MPPQANCNVTALAGAGVADDWDRPAAAGAAKWSGSVRGYLRESVDRVAGAGGLDVLKRRTLYLDTADADLMGIDTDDRLTVEPDGLAPFTITATLIARSALKGIPRNLQTTRVELETG